MASSGEPYAVYTTRTADRGIEKLPAQDREKVEQAIYDLGDEPYPRGAAKMQGASGYRLRQGDYRILYEVDETAREITVTKVAHRREVYR